MELFFWVVLILIIYFAPALNAYKKKKKNREAILALNFFLGWSGLGWITALVWSCTND